MIVVLFNSLAQKDTILVDAKNLNIKDIHFGNSTFMIYSKKGGDIPAQHNTLVKINVEKRLHNGKDAIAINQVWDAGDTTEHISSSLLDAKDLSTIQHSYWWKRNGQSVALDFEKKTSSIGGKVTEDQKEKIINDFNKATEAGYFLNWHCDLIIFPLLLFKENAVFKIKFHDPGIGVPTTEIYTLLKSETLKGLGGEDIDCWVIEYPLPSGMLGYQRYWISKKSKEFIKEEDKVGDYYRIKLRMLVSESE